MRVIVGCETSAKVRDEFRKLGHDAWSCDLLPCAGDPRWHRQCDILEILDEGWDLGIVHPPCTYLTVSAAWAFGDGPYHQKVKPGTLVGAPRREAREKAITFAKTLFEFPAVKRMAMENPIGFLNTRFRKPDQIVQPYQFGHDASKSTGLWLRGLPTLNPTEFVFPRMVCRECKGVSGYKAAHKVGCEHCGAEPGLLQPRWANQTDSGQNNLSPSDDRGAVRSITYEGIARAMAEQWGACAS